MKLVCIGASYKFVRKVVTDLMITGEFEASEIIVVDICQEPLDIVVNACRAVVDRENAHLRIRGTLDRKEALPGADFVLVSITVGGFDAWKKDIDVCLEYGIRHVIGDTIGPAALARSLRTVPVMLDIARDIREYCPEAWIINVSNPMTTSVKALVDIAKVKAVGLCHGSDEIRTEIAGLYDVDKTMVECSVLGVNHLGFAGRIRINGADKTDRIYQDALAHNSGGGHTGWQLGREFLRLFGHLPLTDDKHLIEFFPYYIGNPSSNGQRYGCGPIDFDDRIAKRDLMAEIHRKLAAGTVTLDRPLRYSGEDVHQMILSLYKGQESIQAVNIPNRGYCSGLPENTVLEIPAVVSKNSIQGMSIEEEFAPHILSLLHGLNVLYDYTVEAAVNGDRNKAMQALLLDPMMRDRDVVACIPALLEKLISINRDYLPAFQ